MNFQDVLNSITTGSSDNKTSRKLGITRQMFSAYRNGRRLPSDEVLDKMAELTDYSLEQIYLAAYAEKLHNPRVAKAFRHLAAH